MKKKIGIVGCGGRIRGVANKIVQKYEDQIEVVGLVDPDERSLTSAQEIWGKKALIYDNYEGMLQEKSIDWIFVGSWNCHHKEHVVKAFEAGKHVFCEKPLATNMEDCLAMRDAWKKSGKQFNIGFTLRYSPHYRKLKEIISDGKVGKILSLELNETIGFNHGGYIMGNWRRLVANAGTHLLEKCSHDIDQLLWMVDSKPVKAASFGGNDFFIPENVGEIERVGPDKNGSEAFRTWPSCLQKENPFTSDKDIIDNQVAIVEFENKVRVTFHANCHSAIPERRMYVCGTEGTLRADIVTGRIELKRIGFDTETIELGIGETDGHGGGDNVLCDELFDTIVNDTPPATGLDDGLKSAITCFGIDQAMNTNQVVDLNPLWEEANL